MTEGEDTSMRCPYLIDSEDRDERAECTATERFFEPSVFEMEEYCTTALHRRCPLYHHLDADHETMQPTRGIRREVKRAIG